MRRTLLIEVALLPVCSATESLHAPNPDDFDDYELRIDRAWFYFSPAADIQRASEKRPVMVQQLTSAGVSGCALVSAGGGTNGRGLA